MKNKHVFRKSAIPKKKRLHDEIIYYLITVVFLIIISIPGYGQSGMIKGKVMDKATKEPIPFANVAVKSGGALITGTTTDFDGNYIIRHISPGLYELNASFVGCKTAVVKGVMINSDQITFQDIQLEVTAETLDVVEVVSYKVPLISKDRTTSGATVTSSAISKLPGRSSNTAATKVGGVFSGNSKKSRVRGARNNHSVMYINGVKVTGSEATTPDLQAKNESHSEAAEPLHHKLTAGEINDFSKWKYWTGAASDEFELFKQTWGIFPQNRYCVQVMNENGFPVVGCKAMLVDETGNALWTAKTDNTGKAELWKDIFNESDEKEKVKVLLEKDGIYETIKKPKNISKGVNTVILKSDCDPSKQVDVMFTIDATGSMDDEIDYLKAELKNIINSFADQNPELELRLGSVFYRCFGNEYVTRKADFSADINQIVGFIRNQNSGEGGTEAVEEALRVSVEEMDWSEDARAKIMFIILDEPPGQDPEIKATLKEQIAKAADMGIRIIPVVASGMFEYESDKTLEFLMRSIALATNGTYVFLTDDSGIGNAHSRPSIDDYEVELLNDLIVRLLQQYTFIEPSKEPVVEEVAEADSVQWVVEEETRPLETLKDEKLVPDTPGPKGKIWVKAFPNPTSGKVTIEHGKKVDEMFVTDLSGKILMRIETERKVATCVDLSAFPNGLYFLRYTNVDHWENAKIIVRH